MSENDKEKKLVHKIAIDRNPEIDSLHQELYEKNAIIENASLQKLSEEKEKLKEKYGEYSEEIDGLSGSEIDKFKLRMFDKQQNEKPKQHAPYGKSSLTRQPSGEEFEDQRAMIDELYSKAYDKTRTDVSEIERKEAGKKIEKLIQSMIEGKSWGQLQRQKLTPQMRHWISCPKCGKSIDTDVDKTDSGDNGCRYCNYKLKKSDW